MFGFTKNLRRMLAAALVLVCVLTLSPLQVRAANDVDVFYQSDSKNDNKVVAVQVASSGSLSNCESCVRKLREAGYNAYLYQPEGSKSYAILVGVFGKAAEAEELAVKMHKGPAVKGVKMEKAFARNAYISDAGVLEYSYPYYGGKIPESGSVTRDTDEADVFFGYDSNTDNTVVAVQVASSSSIANCKTCVRRLREAGYNPWLYKADENSNYKLVIGAFSSKAAAAGLIDELKNAPAVKGVKLSSAFAMNARISDAGLSIYSNPYYDGNVSSGGKTKYLVDCEILSSTDYGGSDISVGSWKDNFGGSHQKSMKFWVRDGGGYVDTESITYRVGKGYISLTGNVVASSKNETKAKSTVSIYVDGNLVYKSGQIGSATEPEFYEIVLGGMPAEITVECTTDSNAFGHCIVSGILHPEEGAEPEAEQESDRLRGKLESWSGSKMKVSLMEYRGWNEAGSNPVYKSTGETKSYDIGGADICFESAWGDDSHFSSLDAALKHEIEGWGCNIKEAMGGEVLLSFRLDGSKVSEIVLLYMA